MNVLCTWEKTIKYTFLDQNGQGIPGIHGQLLVKQGVLYDQNITQSNGELLLKAPFNPKDSYVLRAEYKDITIYDDRLEKTLKKLRKEVTVGLYEFSVIITDSLGLPPGIEVTPILVTSKSNSTVQITPKENSQGSFTFEGVPAGDYHVQINYGEFLDEVHVSIPDTKSPVEMKFSALFNLVIDLYDSKGFQKYCERQALTQISQLTSDFIRRYLLEISETHNPGGVHACFRPLRTMLYWIEEEEIMPTGGKNPIRRVKAPKLPTDPIEPVQIEEIHQLLKTCHSNYSGVRDKAMMLGLLDTGARAKEFLNINLKDVDMATGAVMIRQGKGRKPRMVFLRRKTSRAIRGYLRYRHDDYRALWVSIRGERMTYAEELLRQRR